MPEKSIRPYRADCSAAVLVVDDEPCIRRALARELSKGFDVVLSSNFEEALDRLGSVANLRAVVSDFQLGGGPGGVEVLIAAQERAPFCLRILLSGLVTEAEADRLLSRGIAHRLVGKPWVPGEVLAIIHGEAVFQ